jgi:hypothetical protein
MVLHGLLQEYLYIYFILYRYKLSIYIYVWVQNVRVIRSYYSIVRNETFQFGDGLHPLAT